MPIERINLTYTPRGGFVGGNNVTVHTTGISSTTIDVVHLWVYLANSGGAADLQLYTTDSPFPAQMVITIPTKTVVKVLDGINLCGNGSTGGSISIYCPNYLGIGGYVLRITP